MVKLQTLSKTVTKTKKRRGRGMGSGKGGHTVGRGQKGQKSRGKVALTFEGTKIKKSLLKRLPLLRGKGKLTPRKKPLIVNLAYLNLLPKGSIVDLDILIKEKIIRSDATNFGVKILGEGELNYPLTVKLPVSRQARAKIEKAGGKVLQVQEAPTKKVARTRKSTKRKE